MIQTFINKFSVHRSPLTVLRVLKEAEDELREHEIQNPRLDAEILLSMILENSRTGLYAEYDRILTPGELDRFRDVVERRLRREPLQYITENCDFCGLEFMVNPDVFIPRPETEILVKESLKHLTVNGSRFTILDLCTGSGCISIALAKGLKTAEVFAVDISAKALRMAKENGRRHGVEEKIKFIRGNLFEPFTDNGSQFTVHSSQFDLIVSNPPYISSHEIDRLQPEVRDYEPREALDGGPDGLLYLERIIKEAPEHLSSGGSLLLEIGYDQREGISNIIKENGGYLLTEFIKDHAGLDRVVAAVRP